MAKVRVEDSGCWTWTGRTHRGYGCLGRSGAQDTDAPAAEEVPF